jgi:1-deoxy-D-xylulose-5-phosphate reductoisomerase
MARPVALANKEVLVMAGQLVTDAARRHGASILPVDSEHNAIHQCLHGRDRSEIKRLVLTASGGPFRGFSAEALDTVDARRGAAAPDMAHGTEDHDRLRHVDEKGTRSHRGALAVWRLRRADRCRDSSTVDRPFARRTDRRNRSSRSSASPTCGCRFSMRVPYPERWEARSLPTLDLLHAGRLDFHAPARDRFPCLDLAYRALRVGGTLPVVLNAANELPWNIFLDGKLGFTAIPRVIQETMDAHDV